MNLLFKSSNFTKLEKAVKDFHRCMEFRPSITSCDHICYIVKTKKDYDSIKNTLSKTGTVIREIGETKHLGGKAFFIIKLADPVKFMNFDTEIVELKLTDFEEFSEGWQHVEFTTKEPLEYIVKMNPEIPFETHRINNHDNKEIGYRISKQYSIKFRVGSVENL